MALYGIGTDIVEVRRIAALIARHGARAARHILAPEELAEYDASAFPERFLAKRFAAKEAFAKALGTGLRGPVRLSNIRVVHDPLGKPAIACTRELDRYLRTAGVGACHLSLADEKELVTAFVVLERV